MLNVLNEQGEIVGTASREDIHKEGLLHAEAHVWFYTPDGKIIWQLRSKDKDTFPDLLDATVGGHVEIGDTYEQTAAKEAREETGVDISQEDLIFLRTTITKSYDEATGTTNHPRRNVYAYCFRGKIEDLRIEPGASQGFEAWPIEALMNLSPEESRRFIPSLIDENGMETIEQIRNLI